MQTVSKICSLSENYMRCKVKMNKYTVGLPFEWISIDRAGLFSKTREDKYILVA